MGKVELTPQQEIELEIIKAQEEAVWIVQKRLNSVVAGDRVGYLAGEVRQLLVDIIKEIRGGKNVAKVEVDPAEKTMQDRYEELSDRRKRLEAKGDLLNAALVDVRRAELVVICGILDIPLQQRREG